MNRRSLIPLFIGAIAMVSGLATLYALRQDRCLDAGGKWIAGTRACTGPAGPLAINQGSDIVAAVLVGLGVAFMLFRATTFALRGGTRGPS